MAKKLFILLFIFVAGYMGSHFYLKAKNQSKFDAVKISKMVDCSANQIREITIHQKHSDQEQKLKFQRIDNKAEGQTDSSFLAQSDWRWVSPNPNAEADPVLFTRLASMLCETFEPTPAKAEEMGVPSPSARNAMGIEFVQEVNGKTVQHKIRFGGLNQDRKSVVEYVSPSGSQYFQIQSELLQVSSLEEKNFFNMRILKMNIDNAQFAEVERNKKESFEVQRNGSDWSLVTKKSKPDPNAHNPEAAKYINRISTLKAIGILDTDFPAAKCEESGGTVRVDIAGVADRKETIYFTPKGQEYLVVCNTARNTKFKVHRDMWKYLMTPLKELAKK